MSVFAVLNYKLYNSSKESRSGAIGQRIRSHIKREKKVGGTKACHTIGLCELYYNLAPGRAKGWGNSFCLRSDRKAVSEGL